MFEKEYILNIRLEHSDSLSCFTSTKFHHCTYSSQSLRLEVCALQTTDSVAKTNRVVNKESYGENYIFTIFMKILPILVELMHSAIYNDK